MHSPRSAQTNYPIELPKKNADKDTVSFPFTCIPDTTAKSAMLAFRLYWELIAYYASRGTRIVHSGRVPFTDKTDDYRLGWGGTKYTYYYSSILTI